MAQDIGPRIGVEGEEEYRNSIMQIIQQAKTLDAEMRAVTASFTKETTAQEKASALSEKLAERIDQQKERVRLLAEMVEKSTEATGENSSETLKWREALANAQGNLNKLENESAELASSIDDLGEEVEDSGSEMEDAGKKAITFGDLLKSNLASEAIIAGVRALWDEIKGIASAAVEFGKDVINSYAEFEQLEGGVKKLFGDDYQRVMDNATEGFKSAGLSMNEYMETVTSFSASLISSLGGDTKRAADYADMAIRDMSDNANTFGTDISSIQNAYNGFAKGTFTMLDNLKLGYGGTKEEMQRLLSDAEAIQRANGNMVTYSIDSFSDMVEAIHVVQENMGIAGTTAAEAEHTISGSINTLKSSFENFVIGLGTEGADIEKLTQNMTDAFLNVVTNVQPVVERLLQALPDAISTLVPVLIAEAPKLIYAIVKGLVNAWPAIKQAGAEIVNQIGQAIRGAVDAARAWGRDLIQNFINGLADKAQELWDNMRGIAQGIRNFIGFSEPEKGPLSDFHTYAPDMVELFAQGIRDNRAILQRAVADTFDLEHYIRGGMGGGSAYNYGGVVVNIYPDAGMSADEIYDTFKYRLQHDVVREEAVFAS